MDASALDYLNDYRATFIRYWQEGGAADKAGTIILDTREQWQHLIAEKWQRFLTACPDRATYAELGGSWAYDHARIIGKSHDEAAAIAEKWRHTVSAPRVAVVVLVANRTLADRVALN